MRKPALISIFMVTAFLLLLIVEPVLAKDLTLRVRDKAGGGVRLELEGDAGLLNFKRMYPGNSQKAEVAVVNSCSKPCLIRLDVKRGRQEHGGADLFGKLHFTIGGAVEAQSDLLDKIGPIRLRELGAGESQVLSIAAKLPEEAGNEYQCLSGELKYVFSVRVSKKGSEKDHGDHSGGRDNDGGDSRGDRPRTPGEVEVPPEETPIGRPGEPGRILEPPVEVPEEPLSLDTVPFMPKTGERSPLAYYLFGGLSLLTGLGMACPGEGRKVTFHNSRWFTEGRLKDDV